MKKFEFYWNKRKYTISLNGKVFIVAEAGVNHNGNLNLAKELIKQAKLAGADAIKFQTFITEKITTPFVGKVDHIRKTTSNKKTWAQTLKELELSINIHKNLINYCKEQKILFLSTPYDYKSADLLDSLGVPLFKISSTDLTNVPFLKYISKKGKPMILSTGMSNLSEVKEAILTCKKSGVDKLIVLQCTSNYPADIKNANINVLDYYKNKFKVLVGYSDHTEGEISAICACAKGAVLIEKHFTLDKRLPGPDQGASADPEEMKRYIEAIRNAYIALGDGIKRIMPEEKSTKSKMQKSLTSSRAIKTGETISAKDILIRRPATGIAPKMLKKVIGKKVAKDIKADIPIMETDIVF